MELQSRGATFQDTLNAMILSTFTNEEAKIYVMSFKSFLDHDPDNEFIVDFDDAYKWVGFTRKDNAKRLLDQKFQENKDYRIVFLSSEENSTTGRPSAQIMLTINCFKRFCLRLPQLLLFDGSKILP